jgi:hypothetical protein
MSWLFGEQQGFQGSDVALRRCDGRGCQAHNFLAAKKLEPGTRPAFCRGLAIGPRTDVPSQTDVGKECLAERNALRAQSSFEGALSGNRNGSTGLRRAWPTKREMVAPHQRFDSCRQVMEDERSGCDAGCARVGGPGTQLEDEMFPGSIALERKNLSLGGSSSYGTVADQ